MTLWEEMSLEQGLGLVIEELALNVYLDKIVYSLCYLIRETDRNLVLVVPDEEGHEHVKVVNKDYVEAIEIVYQDMLVRVDEQPNDGMIEDYMYV